MAQIITHEPKRVSNWFLPLTIMFAIISLPFVILIVLASSYPRHIYTMTKRIILTSEPYLEFKELR